MYLQRKPLINIFNELSVVLNRLLKIKGKKHVREQEVHSFIICIERRGEIEQEIACTYHATGCFSETVKKRKARILLCVISH